MTVNLTDLIRALSERQFATERQLGELADAVKALQARVEELSAAAPAVQSKTTAAASEAVHGTRAEVTPEMRIRIETETEMTGTADVFRMTGTVRAFENGELVVERVYDQSFPRDHL